MTDVLDKFKKANDELHEAFNDVLKDEGIDVGIKTEAGSSMHSVFTLLEEVHIVLGGK